jgi:hypothetical protein
LSVIPAHAGIQKGSKGAGFPASSAGQALLEFIPMEIGAGMTSLSDALFGTFFQKAKSTQKFLKNDRRFLGRQLFN